jgi:DNA-binding response OmpR family regulator
MNPDSQPPPCSDVAADSDRPKVLLVEDHADMRAYLRKHLAPHYELLEAARGDAGLELARKEMPDVVVSDIMMPGMDGYALCRSLKADAETDYIPVVLLTAKAGTPSKIQGLEGGADDYLTKPFDPTELLLRIRNLLRARARLRARFSSLLPAPSPQPTPLVVAAPEAALVKRIQEVLDGNLQEESFDVNELARQVGMSRAQLYRRTGEALGVTPSDLILRFRLERAAQLLVQRAGNVGDIGFAVGFKNLSHFIKRFRERYGQTPAAYAAGQRQPPDPPGQ